MKIAFAASRKLSIDIIDWIYKVKHDFDIELVGGVVPNEVEWWDSAIDKLYERLNIPSYRSLEELVDKSKPDLVFSLNYWKIIPSDILSKVNCGIINLHHSYLLRFRGRHTCSWAIIHARKDNNWVHGTTLHYIDEELDNGNIIDSWSCEIKETDTAEILFNRVENLAYEMFITNFSKILLGVDTFKSPDSQYYYYNSASKGNLEVDITMPIVDIYDYVRAWTFSGRPRPYIPINNSKIFLSIENK
jgi:methionyl-tRNA formyltransferase